jgi:nucleotide-binding universal stress UspA family protein
MHTEVGAWSGRSHPRGSVVCGYNGTDHSRAALTWAAAEAARRDAPLLVLFAANYSGMTLEPGPGLLEREPRALEDAEEVTAGGVLEALELDVGMRVAGATEVTSPSQALVEASEHAELIVLGSRGYGRLVGALLGSVAFAVSARARCPVIVVKAESVDRQGGPARRVVVGTDGSAGATAAVGFAAERAAATSAVLDIVTCTGGRQVRNIDVNDLRAAAVHIAAAAESRLQATHPGLTVTTRVEDCPAEITLIGASSTADLVVVGTRGRGAFEGMMLGSVSHAVIHGAQSAVAAVGPDEV